MRGTTAPQSIPSSVSDSVGASRLHRLKSAEQKWPAEYNLFAWLCASPWRRLLSLFQTECGRRRRNLRFAPPLQRRLTPAHLSPKSRKIGRAESASPREAFCCTGCLRRRPIMRAPQGSQPGIQVRFGWRKSTTFQDMGSKSRITSRRSGSDDTQRWFGRRIGRRKQRRDQEFERFSAMPVSQ